MPTNDERRQVAARLRDYATRDFEESNPWWYLSKAVTGSFAAYDDVSEYFTDLADLIEPSDRKCHIEMIDTGNEAAYEHCEHIAHCHSCHHEFGYVLYNEDGDTWQDEKPNFCPNCGAKVVD